MGAPARKELPASTELNASLPEKASRHLNQSLQRHATNIGSATLARTQPHHVVQCARSSGRSDISTRRFPVGLCPRVSTENLISQRFLNRSVASQTSSGPARFPTCIRTCIDTRPHHNEAPAHIERKLEILGQGQRRLWRLVLCSVTRFEGHRHMPPLYVSGLHF